MTSKSKRYLIWYKKTASILQLCRNWKKYLTSRLKNMVMNWTKSTIYTTNLPIESDQKMKQSSNRESNTAKRTKYPKDHLLRQNSFNRLTKLYIRTPPKSVSITPSK